MCAAKTQVLLCAGRARGKDFSRERFSARTRCCHAKNNRNILFSESRNLLKYKMADFNFHFISARSNWMIFEWWFTFKIELRFLCEVWCFQLSLSYVLWKNIYSKKCHFCLRFKTSSNLLVETCLIRFDIKLSPAVSAWKLTFHINLLSQSPLAELSQTKCNFYWSTNIFIFILKAVIVFWSFRFFYKKFQKMEAVFLYVVSCIPTPDDFW